jgi:hypothetical protein
MEGSDGSIVMETHQKTSDYPARSIPPSVCACECVRVCACLRNDKQLLPEREGVKVTVAVQVTDAFARRQPGVCHHGFSQLSLQPDTDCWGECGLRVGEAASARRRGAG